mgnify:CR=1 FL=1
MVSITHVLIPGAALLATVLSIELLKRPAPNLRLTDQPGHRKHHQGAIPLIGGIAMMAVFILLLPWLHGPENACLSLLPALFVVTAVGALDDARDLSPRSRLIAQILAGALMMALGGAMLDDLGNLLGTGTLSLGLFGIPFTLFCVVGVINALNMVDGMDGLAGGIALIATGWLALLVWLAGQAQMLTLLLLLGAVIGGFLCFNLRHPWRQRASVFMGDAGSMGLGFILAWLLVSLSQGEARTLSPITAVWILALPLIDTVSIMIRRRCRGVSPFAADRQHLHHLFHRLGFSDGQTTALLLAIAGTLGAIGVAGQRWGIAEHWMHLAFWVLFIAYHLGMHRIWPKLEQSIHGTPEPFRTLNSVTTISHAPSLVSRPRLAGLQYWMRHRVRRRKRALVDTGPTPGS